LPETCRIPLGIPSILTPHINRLNSLHNIITVFNIIQWDEF